MKNGKEKKNNNPKLYAILSKLSESRVSGTPLSFLFWLSLDTGLPLLENNT